MHVFGGETDPYRTSVLLAGHNFNSRYINKNVDQFKQDPTYIDPLYGVEGVDQNIAATISEVLSVKGPTCPPSSPKQSAGCAGWRPTRGL